MREKITQVKKKREREKRGRMRDFVVSFHLF